MTLETSAPERCLQGQWVNALVLRGALSRRAQLRLRHALDQCDCFDAAMAYFHIDRMQRYLQSLGFANVVHRAIPVNLHATAEDNSFYSPTTRALNFGDGGVDDAQDADVISHEYGHAIQDSQVPGFGVTTEGGTMGEGFGDYWQAAMSANQGNADVFNTCFAEWDTSRGQRRPASLPAPRRPPVDGRPGREECGGREIHCVGQAWSNLLWTIRKQLGGAKADQLVVQSQFSYAIESGFRDASLALLFADRQLNGGANRAFLQNLLVGARFPDARELDDQPSGALPLAFPGSANGAAGVNTDERDVFAVQLAAGPESSSSSIPRAPSSRSRCTRQDTAHRGRDGCGAHAGGLDEPPASRSRPPRPARITSSWRRTRETGPTPSRPCSTPIGTAPRTSPTTARRRESDPDRLEQEREGDACDRASKTAIVRLAVRGHTITVTGDMLPRDASAAAWFIEVRRVRKVVARTHGSGGKGSGRAVAVVTRPGAGARPRPGARRP